MNNKEAEYQKLVARRKAHKFNDPELLNPSEIEDGIYDTNHLNAWATWFGNLNAQILLIGQDFSDEKYFVDNKGIDNPKSETNRLLTSLFAEIGFDLSNPKTPLYLTNSVLGIKKDGMNAPIKSEWYLDTANEFIKPLIEIIKPKVVIAMSEAAYKTIRAIYPDKKLPNKSLKELMKLNPFVIDDNLQVFVVYHCSRNGQRTQKLEQQKEDWQRIKPYIDKLQNGTKKNK